MGLPTGGLIVAGAFALACGVNDGGALVALSLRVRLFRPITAVMVLASLLVLAPLVVGTRVAQTLTERLVAFSGSDGRTAAIVATVVSLVVVFTLARLRIPTSLSLAVIGALVGAGLAYGFAVSWSIVALVLVAGAAGPFVGAAIATAVVTGVSRLPEGLRRPPFIRGLHVVGYGAECLAYGVNDGQRMLAIFALTTAATATVDVSGAQLSAIGVLFAVGASIGMFRYVRTLGSALGPVRPHDGAVAELGGAGASFAGAFIGAPLSMTQAVTGGLVGSAALRGWRRIHWGYAARLAVAWSLTLPAGVAGAALVGTAVRAVS
jgi:PiT family inorganic phosphate transporter